MKPFHQNGEESGGGAVCSRKRHSQVLRGLGGLPERASRVLNSERGLRGQQAEEA